MRTVSSPLPPPPGYCPANSPGAAMPITFRTRLLPRSAKIRLPAASIAGEGVYNCAAVAGPPSPAKLPGSGKYGPLPATVLIFPSGLTFRIRLLNPSAKNRLPALSTASWGGKVESRLHRRAAVSREARRPGPGHEGQNPCRAHLEDRLSATAQGTGCRPRPSPGGDPERHRGGRGAVLRRGRAPTRHRGDHPVRVDLSHPARVVRDDRGCPPRRKHYPLGAASCAWVAEPPSPENPSWPCTRHGGDDAVWIDLPHPVVERVPDVEVAGGIQCEALRPFSSAWVAGPPSPP